MEWRTIVNAALREDRARTDLTARLFIDGKTWAKARIAAKEPGILCGGEAAALAFRRLDRTVRVRIRAKDGARLARGSVVLEANGRMAGILSVERTALNILSHLSGVATLTRSFVDAAGPKGPAVLDTRKTLPGLRDAQKYAVLCGGGKNHRRDLADGVLIKENHLAAVRTQADFETFLDRVRLCEKTGKRVVMECQNRRHVVWGLLSGASVLMLDNCPIGKLRGAVAWTRAMAAQMGVVCPQLEVSGGVTLKSIRRIAAAGVDRVSIGRLTHSAPSLDMSLDVRPL